MLNQLKRKCKVCLFHQARVCKYIPLTQTPISYLGYYFKNEKCEVLKELKPVSVTLEIIGEPAHIEYINVGSF